MTKDVYIDLPNLEEDNPMFKGMKHDQTFNLHIRIGGYKIINMFNASIKDINVISSNTNYFSPNISELQITADYTSVDFCADPIDFAAHCYSSDNYQKMISDKILDDDIGEKEMADTINKEILTDLLTIVTSNKNVWFL